VTLFSDSRSIYQFLFFKRQDEIRVLPQHGSAVLGLRTRGWRAVQVVFSTSCT
jgi:hypothetical protein